MALPAWSFPAVVSGVLLFPALASWQLSGLWQQLTDAVNQADRLAAGRAATPSLVCLDSQSVRLAPRIFEHQGLDGSKHVNGRKRQILTDVQGRSWPTGCTRPTATMG